MSKKEKLELTPYLEISTAHVTEQDGKLWTNMKEPKGHVIATYPEGAYMYLPDDPDFRQGLAEELLEEGFSPSFVLLVGMLLALNFRYVRFDCDGPEYAQFPKYEW